MKTVLKQSGNRCMQSGLLPPFWPLRFHKSTFKVLDLRNDYLYVLEDTQKQLTYLRQIETEDHQRGIVLKIQENMLTYVAMYKPVTTTVTELIITRNNINWKDSVEAVSENIMQKGISSVFDVEGQTILAAKEQAIQSSLKHQSEQTLPRGRRLPTLSPILNTCHDLAYGDMIGFMGSLGSRKSTTLCQTLDRFAKNLRHISLYFNSHSFSQATNFVANRRNCFAFNNGNIDKSNHTDVGVYMLAVKTIALANILKKHNYDVLLGIDNFKSVLEAEWHMLHLLQGGDPHEKRKLGDIINYNMLKIAPISILNEVYSSCVDNVGTPMKKEYLAGSLSAIIASEGEHSNLMTPEITPFSNNLKHLATLCKNIEFPIDVKLNNNLRGKHFQNSKDEESVQECYQQLRTRLNQHISEQQSSELKRKIYKSDLTEAPWDYYHIFDANWWIKGLKEFKADSVKDCDEFVKWIVFNIREQLGPQWRVSAKDSFKLLQKHHSKEIKEFNREHYAKFVSQARMDGHFSVFKKDYL